MEVPELVAAIGRLSPLERYAFVRQLIERGLARHAAAMPDRFSCVEFAPDFFGSARDFGTTSAPYPDPDPELALSSYSGSLVPNMRGSFEEDLGRGVRGETQGGTFLKKFPLCTQKIRPNDLLLLWNATVQRLPKAYALTEVRQRQARARLREFSSLDWAATIRRLDASPFCTGVNDRGWCANFDFFLRPTTIPKLLEGIYDRRTRVERGGRAQPTDPAATRAYMNRLFGSRSSEE
jgi:hypothetical protein